MLGARAGVAVGRAAPAGSRVAVGGAEGAVPCRPQRTSALGNYSAPLLLLLLLLLVVAGFLLVWDLRQDMRWPDSYGTADTGLSSRAEWEALDRLISEETLLSASRVQSRLRSDGYDYAAAYSAFIESEAVTAGGPKSPQAKKSCNERMNEFMKRCGPGATVAPSSPQDARARRRADVLAAMNPVMVDQVDDCLTDSQQQVVNVLRTWERLPASGNCTRQDMKAVMISWSISYRKWNGLIWDSNGESMYPVFFGNYNGPLSTTDCGGELTNDALYKKVLALNGQLVDKRGIYSGFYHLFPAVVAQYARDHGAFSHANVYMVTSGGDTMQDTMRNGECVVAKFANLFRKDQKKCPGTGGDREDRDNRRARDLANKNPTGLLSERLLARFRLENNNCKPVDPGHDVMTDTYGIMAP